MGTWTEPAWLDFLLKTGAIILCISLIYVIIAYMATQRTIFKSVLATGEAPNDLLGYYYLPTAVVRITAVARIRLVTETESGILKNAALLEQSIIAGTEITPDTSQLFFVKYTGSHFAGDEVKLSVNTNGLLDNASSVSDDRFTNVVAALLEAPVTTFEKTAQASARHGVATPAEVVATTVEVKEYRKEFTISPDKITAGQAVLFNWEIDVPATDNKQDTLDASFKVNLPSIFPAAAATNPTVIGNNEVKGLYVRPSISLRLVITPDNGNTLQLIPSQTATLVVPDISRSILVPVTRAVMVKKTQGLKFQNGVLLENSIGKPSEAEAIVKIPVNILKSIFSVPGQLLSFRINRVQQEKSLVSENAALAKATLDSEKAKLGTEAELAKARLDAQKIITSYEQDLLKAKMDTQKAIVEAEKAKLSAETDLTKAKLDAQKTANAFEQELLKAKTDTQKAIIEAEKNNLLAQKDLLKAQQDLLQAQKDLEELRKRLKQG